MSKYIFLIGTGRTGTFYLKHYFEKNYPQARALHEPDRGIKFCTNLFLSHKFKKERLFSFLKKYRSIIDKDLSFSGKEFLVQSDPWFFGFLDVVDEVFDKPYIVHLVRDPFTYIPSQLNMYYDHPIAGFLRDLIPYWKLRGDATGDMSRAEWRMLSHEEKVAWYWNTCNSFIDERASTLANYLRLSFEGLFDPPHNGARAIADFCEIPFNEETVSAAGLEKRTNTQKQRFAPATTWPREKQDHIVSLCGGLREKYGYTSE